MRRILQTLGVTAPACSILAATAWADVMAQAVPDGDRYGYYGHPHMWGGAWGWGGMFLGPLFGLLFIAAVAVAIVFVVRAVGGEGGGHRHREGGGKSALDILDERFARGEVDKEEYEDRKRTLTGG
jgi:putative membrane protein